MNLELYLVGAAASGVLFLIWRNQRLSREVNEAKAQLEINKLQTKQSERKKTITRKKKSAQSAKKAAQDAKQEFIKKYGTKSKSNK